jgi:hypothetical protein
MTTKTVTKLKLFSWLGLLPRDFEVPKGERHHVQVSCWVALPSQAAFMRLTDSPRSFLPYVSIMDGDRDPANPGAKLALANPGTVYMHDVFNHTPGENVWLVHPFNGSSHEVQR